MDGQDRGRFLCIWITSGFDANHKATSTHIACTVRELLPQGAHMNGQVEVGMSNQIEMLHSSMHTCKCFLSQTCLKLLLLKQSLQHRYSFGHTDFTIVVEIGQRSHV